MENRLVTLADRSAWVLAILAAFMDLACRSFAGPRFQEELEGCYRAAVGTEEDLWIWIQNRFEWRIARPARFDMARRLAETRVNEGIRLALLAIDSTPPGNPSRTCPLILCGRGELPEKGDLFAWFNSRKPRLLTADSAWLRALRLTLHEVQSLSGRFAGSSGTLTYDLVSAFAIEQLSPLVRIMTDPVDRKKAFVEVISGLSPSTSTAELSCQLSSNRCPKSVRWACRDRILAFLADVHIVLQLRHSGQLAEILTEQHRRSPRGLWILQTKPGESSATSGNQQLLELFHPHARPLHLPDSVVETCRPYQSARCRLVMCDPARIVWRDYLFHYTRSCPGPWPGEPLHHYHLGMLRGDPLSSHSALDSLIRILLEGRLRASGRLVRGGHPVVSLSSRGPSELATFKRWNRSLARWTLEPYGVAVKRERVKKMGARPAIYGTLSVYRRLRPADFFRFQLVDGWDHWRSEHEWRLKGDLWLDDLTFDDFFAFVPCQDDAERLGSFVTDPVRCVVSSMESCS